MYDLQERQVLHGDDSEDESAADQVYIFQSFLYGF